MNKKLVINRAIGIVCVLLLASLVGCSDKAKDAVENAENAVGDVAQDAADMAETAGDNIADAGKKAEEAVSEFGAESVAYFSSMKERFGNLDGLKDKPEELKKWVDDTLKAIEEKAENVQLPDAASNALDAVKEKLVALKEYLAGEVDQAKIDEHIKGIIESTKKGLGLS